MSESWADDWYKLLEEDEIKEQRLSEESIKRLKTEIELLDKKLNILLDSYLEQVIDSEIYKKKKKKSLK